MTLRRSFSLLLLIAVLFALLPYRSYGASSNRIHSVLTVGNKAQLVGEDAPILIIELKDDLEEEGDLFYLNAEGRSTFG